MIPFEFLPLITEVASGIAFNYRVLTLNFEVGMVISPKFSKSTYNLGKKHCFLYSKKWILPTSLMSTHL